MSETCPICGRLVLVCTLRHQLAAVRAEREAARLALGEVLDAHHARVTSLKAEAARLGEVVDRARDLHELLSHVTDGRLVDIRTAHPELAEDITARLTGLGKALAALDAAGKGVRR